MASPGTLGMKELGRVSDRSIKSGKPGKDLYRALRGLPWSQLWSEEVPRFNQSSGRARLDRVAVVRAVGVVFSESGPASQRAEVKEWLKGLLEDPEEKIRRYAMAALPKLGVEPAEEEALLSMLQRTNSTREGAFLQQTLARVGGVVTLESLEKIQNLSPELRQRLQATQARTQEPGRIRLDAVIPSTSKIRLILRGRVGLEGFVRDEVKERALFRVLKVEPGQVEVAPLRPFSLGDLYTHRCFGTASFDLGTLRPTAEALHEAALAERMTSEAALDLFDRLTDGTPRYRLEFAGQGHRRGAVRNVADQAFERCPRILNDARQALWVVEIHSTPQGDQIQLRPRLSPDPRHAYRLQDVPAASHPPLAACLVRLAGLVEKEVVWDPFCGSGLELIERCLQGGVRAVYGTDLSPEAIAATEGNFRAAGFKGIETGFFCSDFRRMESLPGSPAPGTVSLILSNPPLGRRVRIPNLHGLFQDLLVTAARMLRPGGRLVFTNPLRIDRVPPSLRREHRSVVDLGGFDCQVELYRRT